MFLLALIILAAASAAASSPKAATYAKTSFVQPASPTIVRGWPSAANHRPSSSSSSSSSSLHAKKKGGGEPVTKNGKIQVVLLETVPKVGQTGDRLFVSSAVWQNQLQRQKKARLISEEEVQKIEGERAAEEQQILENAKATKKMLEEAMMDKIGDAEQCGADNTVDDICGIALEMKRKAGPEGSLFGGVNPKMIMEALKETYPNGSFDGRQVKITYVKDDEGKDVKKKDIKHTGEYTVSVSLGKDVDITFILSIVED